MNTFKESFRWILYILGAAIIVVGAIMALLSLLSPLGAYALGLHDLVLILFITMDMCWIAYIVWSGKKLGMDEKKQTPKEDVLGNIRSSETSFTSLVSASGLLLAIGITITLLGDSHLTFFLAAALAALSFITIFVSLETRARFQLLAS